MQPWKALAVSLVVILGTSCASIGRPLPDVAPEINATLRTPVLRVSAGDTLRVELPRNPEWNQVVPVRWDGRASFLFLDEFVVAGLTLEQVDEMLTRAHEERGVLGDVDLSINLEAMAPRHVVVMGEVNEPGQIQLTGRPLSLVEAIGFAGGPIKRTASMEDVVLVRWQPEQQRQVAWMIDASWEYWGAAEPIWLQEHDVIFIPNTNIDDVNIWVDQYIRQMIPLPNFFVPFVR